MLRGYIFCFLNLGAEIRHCPSDVAEIFAHLPYCFSLSKTPSMREVNYPEKLFFDKLQHP